MAIEKFQLRACCQEDIVPLLKECPFIPNLILAFGSEELLASLTDSLKATDFTNVAVCGCTTAGEICEQEIHEDSLVLNLLKFEKSTIREASVEILGDRDSESAGRRLAQALIAPNLKHIFVLSVGHNINGSDLTNGLREALPADVAVTGGLAGDGSRFVRTHVASSKGTSDSSVIGIGFYGEDLRVGVGSLGGWDSFGTERIITKSDRNILYELDNRPALPLYKSYLGVQACDLPASGLLFPLSVRVAGGREPVVRTLLSIDEASQSLIFAGDMPQGCPARLMKANTERLVDGAQQAAMTAVGALEANVTQVALLVSCVGRRLVLKQRAEEEIEAVRDCVGNDALISGFYSYGEIAPFTPNARCELHNQTMTITVMAEV